ncbi:hypothetical protein D3C86_1627860 [compost metagenome]
MPYIGGIVEFTLSVGAITGGPLLAPPIWALFSKRITGKATIWITMISLLVNLIFKIVLPLMTDDKLSRANEMLLGVLLPFLLLVAYELYAASKGKLSSEYLQLQVRKAARNATVIVVDEKEAAEIKRQNKFGLQVISFSLGFIALMLYVLCAFTAKGTGMVAGIATLILLSAWIPFNASRKAS